MAEHGTPYNFTPNGRAHVILAMVQERGRRLNHLADMLDSRQGHRRRKLHSLLANMLGNGLLWMDEGGWYQRTDHGDGVLSQLDAAAAGRIAA